MLFHLLDHLKLAPADTLFIAIKETIDLEFQLTSQVRDEYPDIDLRVVHLKYDTRGTCVCVWRGGLVSSRDLAYSREVRKHQLAFPL